MFTWFCAPVYVDFWEKVQWGFFSGAGGICRFRKIRIRKLVLACIRRLSFYTIKINRFSEEYFSSTVFLLIQTVSQIQLRPLTSGKSG